MDYDFKLTKPLPQRILHNSSVNPTTEQRELAVRITDLTLSLLVDTLIITDQTELLIADVPFHLFEISNSVCDLLVLEHGCVIMLDLTKELPHIEWHDNDIGTVQRKTVEALRAIISALKSVSTSGRSFTLVSAI